MAGPGQGDLMQRLARMLMGNNAHQQPAPGATPNPFSVPFAGLRNAPQGLPPFQQPGADFRNFQNSQAMQVAPEPQPLAVPPPAMAQAPQPQPVIPPVPDMPAAEPIAAGLPGVQQDVMKAFLDMQRRNLLPEQWKGSFSPGYGEPV